MTMTLIAMWTSCKMRIGIGMNINAVPSLTAFALFLLSPPALCGEASPQQNKFMIAVVNMNKVVDEYAEFRKANEDYEAQVNWREQMLRVREMLKPDEWRELENLEALEREGRLNNEGRKRLGELKQISEERQNMLNLLMTRKLTEEERKQLEELQEIRRSNEEKLKALRDKYVEEINKLRNAYLERFGKRIAEAIKTVAQRYGIKLVIARRIDVEWQALFDEYEMVLYADPTLEITQEVLNILNASQGQPSQPSGTKTKK